MRYAIQFSILMLCAKYQKAGLCGSREKCDRNFLWRRRRRHKTTDSDPYMSPPLKRAGDIITESMSDYLIELNNMINVDIVYFYDISLPVKVTSQARSRQWSSWLSDGEILQNWHSKAAEGCLRTVTRLKK